jgi:hypothetical protein
MFVRGAAHNPFVNYGSDGGIVSSPNSFAESRSMMTARLDRLFTRLIAPLAVRASV